MGMYVVCLVFLVGERAVRAEAGAVDRSAAETAVGGMRKSDNTNKLQRDHRSMLNQHYFANMFSSCMMSGGSS